MIEVQPLQHSATLHCKRCVSHKGLYQEQHRRKHTKYLRKHVSLQILLKTTLVLYKSYSEVYVADLASAVCMRF